MKEKTLDHTLSYNDGYGEYEAIIASQSNNAGVKRLILISCVNIVGVNAYYKIEHNGAIVGFAFSLDVAKQKYNAIK